MKRGIDIRRNATQINYIQEDKGDDIMATKSMLKDVDIKEKYLGRNLVEALEKAKQHKRKIPDDNFKCEEITKDKLKDIFG